jgi:hypothetical protein
MADNEDSTIVWSDLCGLCLEPERTIVEKQCTNGCKLKVHEECFQIWNTRNPSICPVCRRPPFVYEEKHTKERRCWILLFCLIFLVVSIVLLFFQARSKA